jgi:general secretion pathway protein J
LLIAMTLSVMVMVTLAMGMYVVTKDWQRTGDRLEASLDDSLIILQLERALEAAFPHTYLDREKNIRVIFFEGDQEQLSWISTVSPGQGNELSLWQIKPGKKNKGLILTVLPALAGNPTERLEKAEGIDILSDYQIRLEYVYYQDRFGEIETKWTEDWSILEWDSERGQARLPSGVRVLFEHQEDAERSVEIIAPIWVNEPIS